MGSIGEALALIIDTLGQLLIGAIIVRFLLQAARADFYNPVSQALVKVTTPFISPFRKFIPGYKGFDIASLVAAYLLSVLATILLGLFLKNEASSLSDILSLKHLIGWPIIGILSLVLNIYFLGLIISIIASWIAPTSANPILILIYQLMQPIQSRIRKIIPPMGMIDISPIFLFLGIRVLKILFVGELAQQMGLVGNYTRLVIGI